MSFSAQYGLCLDELGTQALEHPGCRCQKHPLTKIAFLSRRTTTSGLPGRSGALSSNPRTPSCSIARRTRFSGFVPSLGLRPDLFLGAEELPQGASPQIRELGSGVEEPQLSARSVAVPGVEVEAGRRD